MSLRIVGICLATAVCGFRVPAGRPDSNRKSQVAWRGNDGGEVDSSRRLAALFFAISASLPVRALTTASTLHPVSHGTTIASHDRRTLEARIPARRMSLLMSESSEALAVIGGALAKIDIESDTGWEQYGNAWVLEPSSVPWGVVHFVGGAAFGVAPQLCYDALLRGLVERLGVLVIATPYPLETEHWKLSRMVHQEFEEALNLVSDRTSLGDSAPIYRLGHSLGAKLLVLGAVHEEASADASRNALNSDASLGLLSFNNFGLSDSVALVSDFVSRMEGNTQETFQQETIKSVFNLVQNVAAAAGVSKSMLEVSPTPEQLESVVERSYAAKSTAIWRFESDSLDSSRSLLGAMPSDESIFLNELEGSHLSPVVFRLDAEQVDPRLAMLVGTRGFKFGNAEALEPLIRSICNWILPTSLPAARTVEDEPAE